MDCVRTRRPPEFRRGCAEKRIRGLRKMLAQTEAVRSMIPACAITAVPEGELVGSFNKGEGGCTDDQVVVDRSTLLLCCITGSAKERLVFSCSFLRDNSRLWDSSS